MVASQGQVFTVTVLVAVPSLPAWESLLPFSPRPLPVRFRSRKGCLPEGTTVTGRWWWLPCAPWIPVRGLASRRAPWCTSRDLASRARQDDASARGCCVASHEGDGETRSSIAWPASPFMLAVLPVCASFGALPPFEVIPTGDLPPSTTRKRGGGPLWIPIARRD